MYLSDTEKVKSVRSKYRKSTWFTNAQWEHGCFKRGTPVYTGQGDGALFRWASFLSRKNLSGNNPSQQWR